MVEDEEGNQVFNVPCGVERNGSGTRLYPLHLMFLMCRVELKVALLQGADDIDKFCF